MKKLLLETSFSKIYMIVMIIITLLILGGYFSYAMFTVSKEKGNAISIVTGNLEYKLTVDEEETNKLTVESNSVKDFIVTLSNPNNIKARFNFYYIGSLPNNVTAGYITGDGVNIPPTEVGTNLEKINTTGSSNTYTIRVSNRSDSSTTITLGVNVGLDYNDLSLPSNGQLFEEVSMLASDVVIENLNNGSTYDDGVDTFITGEDPNNYVWYSGKLWRVVSVNNEDQTTKLVTQWNISVINYSNGSTSFKDSYLEDWLNDTTEDGFLGNLRDPDKFIVMDSQWNTTEDNRSLGEITRPNSTSIVTDPIGTLNTYEYQAASKKYIEENEEGQKVSNGYLNNGLLWWLLTPYDDIYVNTIRWNGEIRFYTAPEINGIRPSIVLKTNIKIVDGNGTERDPYRLEGDNDNNLEGTYLKERYSGEYIQFGVGENNLYRIVSHENGIGTKITSAEPLKENSSFKTISFGDNINYSSTNTIGSFLNGEYLTNYIGNNYINMIEENNTWYLGAVGDGMSYKLAKYIDTNMTDLTSNKAQSQVGLLRLGELMAGQFFKDKNNTRYWVITPYKDSTVRYIGYSGNAYGNVPTSSNGVRPSLNLKQNVIITSGDGTKNNPFTLSIQ